MITPLKMKYRTVVHKSIASILVLTLLCISPLYAQEYKAQRYDINSGMEDDYILDIEADENGSIYISNRSGVFKKVGETYTRIPIETRDIRVLNIEIEGNILWYSYRKEYKSIIKSYDLLQNKHVDINLGLDEEQILLVDSHSSPNIYFMGGNAASMSIYLWTPMGTALVTTMDHPIYTYGHFYHNTDDYYYLKLRDSKKSITINLRTLETYYDQYTGPPTNTFYHGDSLFIKQGFHSTSPNGKDSLSMIHLQHNGSSRYVSIRESIIDIIQGEDDKILLSLEDVYLQQDMNASPVRITHLVRKGKSKTKMLSQYYLNGIYYIGTSDGLYKIQKSDNKIISYISDRSLQTRNIIAINDSIVLVATELLPVLLNINTKKEIPHQYPYREFNFIKIDDHRILALNNDNTIRILRSKDLSILHTIDRNHVIETGIKIKNNLLLVSKSHILEFNPETLEIHEICELPYPVYKSSNIYRFPDYSEYFIETNKGLFTYDHKKSTSIIPLFENKEITFVTESKKGPQYLWVCTRGHGIFEWNTSDNSYSQFTTSNSNISHNNVHSLYYDRYNRAWISTDHGISVMNPDYTTFNHLTEKDGLVENEFNRFSSLRLQDSTILFGSINGITRVAPLLIDFKNDEKLQIKKATSEDEQSTTKVLTVNSSNILKVPYKTKKITIEYEDNNLFNGNIRYVNIRNKEDWKYAQNNTIVLKTEDSNNIKLLVSTELGNQTWSTPELLEIEFNRPLYLSYWFYAILIGLITSAFIYYQRYNSNRLQRINREIETEVNNKIIELRDRNEKLEISQKTNDKIFSIIGHDLRSPLIALNNVTKSFNYVLQKGKSKDIYKVGNAVEKNANQALSIVDQLLEWSKYKRQNNLLLETISLKDIFNEIIREKEHSLTLKKIRIENYVQEEFTTEIDKEGFKTILRNIIQNAIKYSYFNSTIIIKQIDGADGVEVIDFGKGMSYETWQSITSQEHIHSEIGTDGEIGTGMGLLLSIQLAQQIGIKLNMKNNIPKGTIIQLFLDTTQK